MLTARNDAAGGQTDAAVAVLRAHRDTYPSAAELLIEILKLAGRLDEAVEESGRAVAAFGDGTFAHNRLNILARAGRQEEAEAYATSLLASATVYRFRIRCTASELGFGAVGRLGHDRGSCLSACCT